MNNLYGLLGIQLAGMVFLQSAIADIGQNDSQPVQLIAMNEVVAQENRSVHPQLPKQKLYSTSEYAYQIPDIALINRYGEKIRIAELLNNQHSVLLQFIFSTCATICPVMSATFASAQDALEKVDPDYRLVTISIDPEQDTPRTLDQYAKRFHARGQWHFLTGSREKITKVQRAFDAYYPGNNKMYHQPFTFMRPQGMNSWVRIDGLMSSADLADEYRKLVMLSGVSN